MYLKFLQVVFIIQMPHLNLLKEAEKLKKEELTDDEKNKLNRRAEYAAIWLQKIADEKFQYLMRKDGISYFQSLPLAIQIFLRNLSDGLYTLDYWTSENIQKIVFEFIKSFNLDPKEGFGYIYQLFLNKDSGPQLGWFLASLDKKFVTDRLEGTA